MPIRTALFPLPVHSPSEKLPICNSAELILGSYQYRYRSQIIWNELDNFSEQIRFGKGVFWKGVFSEKSIF